MTIFSHNLQSSQTSLPSHSLSPYFLHNRMRCPSCQSSVWAPQHAGLMLTHLSCSGLTQLKLVCLLGLFVSLSFLHCCYNSFLTHYEVEGRFRLDAQNSSWLEW